MRPKKPLLYALTAVVVLCYYLFFTWASLRLYFDQDDMMNLYRAWSMPPGQLVRANVFFWGDTFRPLGAVFYRTLFACAGFNPLPFRVVCLGLGLVNIGLCFWFTRLITNSDRVGALTILLFAFHTRLMEVWFRTAVIYDLLCFTFFYIAACLYLDARRTGYPTLLRSIVILLCYVCALDSKEAAVALPVVLCTFECLLMRPGSKQLRLPLAMALITIPYVIGKTSGAGAMTNNPAYRSEYSIERFAHSWSTFLNFLFVLKDGITPVVAVGILAGLLLLTILMRLKKLAFAWVLLFAGTLPVCFLEYRGGFVLYISYVGWCMFAAMLLVKVQDLVPGFRLVVACGVFVLIGWRVGKVNLHDQRADPRTWLYEPPKMVRQMAAEMRELQPDLPKGARLLLVDDAFTTDEWTPWFIIKLLYRDDTLTVDRAKMMERKPADWSSYPFVFTFDQGRYKRLKPG